MYNYSSLMNYYLKENTFKSTWCSNNIYMMNDKFLFNNTLLAAI